jgi:hypothetical protein
VQTSLSHAIQQLIEHPERDRIHKLLYWVCKGKWESSSVNLHQTPIDLLVQELVQSASTFEVLDRRLHKAASVLNKTSTYTRIATLIVYSCADFYSYLSTQCDIEDSAEDTFTCVVLKETSSFSPAPTSISISLDRFELRRLLMQQIPPLKLKILLFSVLHHPFSFSARDWAQLKAKALDTWVEDLVQNFPALDTLEKQLMATATELKSLDQGIQIADIMIQTLRLNVR